MRFFLLRHGQTLFNLQEKVQGHNDSPLTKLGQYQAKCAGYGARNISFDYAYSGDTKRQLDTAKIFLSENHHPVEVISDPHFREMGYGKYEGGSYYDMLNPLYEALHE
ncbi:MAG: histidine phosphatase family protein, partial [Erysipelotrichaceae bacterium]|nr:histidine phosphatase family protein [Erysipelotrichaceae bacterium]